ncbi:hypothetical protein PM3016_4586 [Paenibacillus mucilaginosus 3016]|uniref:PhnB-like domain-containing protein n=1 Tax=Paenibacillus mucilaginosus 3016 TaxID=1116391 RepID=H6NDJ4_9BACL|nr:VOC family protein [Paenibacillus mucilaginosus]AFC31334.1 hypothetical protein PM3016_4586 [Paenibacillus mucilaginosus 3016]WFA19895.1 VOC family protein [Paenibacillus mucilaginosus]
MDQTVPSVVTFFMFSGQAEEAMRFYTSLFEGSSIGQVHYQENGQVLHAVFTVKGQTFNCIDNSTTAEHAFTPAMSLFVTCSSSEEIEHAYEELSRDGQVLMPLGALPPFSEKFGCVQDRFGVSWQLSLPKSG